MAEVVGLLVLVLVELVLVELVLALVELVLVLVELVASSSTFRSWMWLVGVQQVMQPCWKQREFLRFR